jgi:hypothetical protein
LPGSRLVQPGEQTQQGTFAATAAAYHGNELSGRNMQVDVLEDFTAAEGFLQLLYRQWDATQQVRRLLLFQTAHAAPPLVT